MQLKQYLLRNITYILHTLNMQLDIWE